MKQKIGVFLLSALLVLSLSACGERGGAVGDNNIPVDDYATTNKGYNNGTNDNNGTARSSRGIAGSSGGSLSNSGKSGSGLGR